VALVHLASLVSCLSQQSRSGYSLPSVPLWRFFYTPRTLQHRVFFFSIILAIEYFPVYRRLLWIKGVCSGVLAHFPCLFFLKLRLRDPQLCSVVWRVRSSEPTTVWSKCAFPRRRTDLRMLRSTEYTRLTSEFLPFFGAFPLTHSVIDTFFPMLRFRDFLGKMGRSLAAFLRPFWG